MLNATQMKPEGRKTRRQRRNRNAGQDCPYAPETRRASRWYSQQAKYHQSLNQLLSTVERDDGYTPYSRIVAADL